MKALYSAFEVPVTIFLGVSANTTTSGPFAVFVSLASSSSSSFSMLALAVNYGSTTLSQSLCNDIQVVLTFTYRNQTVDLFHPSHPLLRHPRQNCQPVLAQPAQRPLSQLSFCFSFAIYSSCRQQTA